MPEPEPRRGRWRWLRWPARVLLGLLALVLVVVIATVAYVQTPSGNARILRLALELAKEALAGGLEAGSLQLQGGHLILRDVTLRTPEGERVAHIDEVEAQVSLVGLLRNTVRVELLRLEHPQVWLAVDERGLNVGPCRRRPSSSPAVATLLATEPHLPGRCAPDRPGRRRAGAGRRRAPPLRGRRARAACPRPLRRADRRLRRHRRRAGSGDRPGEGPAPDLGAGIRAGRTVAGARRSRARRVAPGCDRAAGGTRAPRSSSSGWWSPRRWRGRRCPAGRCASRWSSGAMDSCRGRICVPGSREAPARRSSRPSWTGSWRHGNFARGTWRSRRWTSPSCSAAGPRPTSP